MNVKDADPEFTQFMQVATRKDGKPVGIIIKRRGKNSRMKKKKPKELSAEEFSDEVLEIIGVRAPDSVDDHRNVYRNAKIVNNKLIARNSFQFHEGE